jgi:hypothetical protein
VSIDGPRNARLAPECIGNSDALHHNVEHTMLVNLAGHEIFGPLAFSTGRLLQLHRRLPVA